MHTRGCLAGWAAQQRLSLQLGLCISLLPVLCFSGLWGGGRLLQKTQQENLTQQGNLMWVEIRSEARMSGVFWNFSSSLPQSTSCVCLKSGKYLAFLFNVIGRSFMFSISLRTSHAFHLNPPSLKAWKRERPFSIILLKKVQGERFG